MFVVFVIPELTKGDLESSFPEFNMMKKNKLLDILMTYNGPNEYRINCNGCNYRIKLVKSILMKKFLIIKKQKLNLTVTNINY